MNDTARSIFRPAALRRYAEAQDRADLPRLVTPCVFLALWLLVGLLAATGGGWLVAAAGGPTLPAAAVQPARLAGGGVVVALLPRAAPSLPCAPVCAGVAYRWCCR
jgi:hypothetical protein